MEIDFYEEFPTQKNLEKLRLIRFKTKLFVASKSIKEFKSLEKQITKIKKNITVAYWPIIKNSYWISPFSNTRDLIELFRELEKIDNQILIDLEMPRNKIMIGKNLFSFFKNKKLIKRFMEKNKERITTAQPIESIFSKYIQIRGQNFNVKTEKSFMWYSSMLPNKLNNLIRKRLPKVKNKSNYSVSLGTITYGVHENEPILKPESLEKDLRFVKQAGFKKVIIFRLGGLNKDYMKVINKFKG